MDPKVARLEIFMDSKKSKIFLKDVPEDLKPFVDDLIDEIFQFTEFLKKDLKQRPNPPVKLALNVLYGDLI